MSTAKDLSLSERLEIEILFTQKGYSMRSIAHALNRGKSTISYEIKENSTCGTYNALKAHKKTRVRKRMRKLEFAKIEEYPEIKKFVIEKLKEHWNPDEIAGYVRRHQKQYPWYVSKTAIYDWLRTARGERYCRFLYSKRKHVKKRKKKTKRVLIPNRVDISKRSQSVTLRRIYGHCEADTVVGKKGTKGGVKTAVERKSRLLLAQKVTSMKPTEHAQVLKKMLKPYNMKTTTFDNGIENRYHEDLGIPTYFCEPYSSWQRGSNEHGNKMLRRYFPKKTNFEEVTQKEIDDVVEIINKKPRKILGYRSSLEIVNKTGMMKRLQT